MIDRTELKEFEDAEFAGYTLSQLEVGQIEISTMAYNTRSLHYERGIEIRSLLCGTRRDWGETIFKGTLKELIEKLELTSWRGVTA